MVVKLLVLCVLFGLASATKVKSCESWSTTPSVMLSACPNGPPCTVKYNTDYKLKITFQPDSYTVNPKNEVTIQKFSSDFHVDDADDLDVCDNLNTADGGKAYCPLEAGKTYVYTVDVKLSQPWWIFTSITANVHWAIESEGTSTVACFEMEDVTIET